MALVFGLRNKPEVDTATFKRLGLDAMSLNPLQPSLTILAGPEGAGKSTVAVSSSHISLARAVSRVARGGHNIPPDTIHRRYARSLHNFFSLYSALVDNWYFFDNSATSALLLACREGMTAEPRYLFGEEYEQFRSKALG